MMRNWFLLLLIWHCIGFLPWNPPPPTWVRQLYALGMLTLFWMGVWFYLGVMPT